MKERPLNEFRKPRICPAATPFYKRPSKSFFTSLNTAFTVIFFMQVISRQNFRKQGAQERGS
jgi:hypothetical protein